MDPHQNLNAAYAQTQKLLKNAKPPNQCTAVVGEIHKRLEMLREIVIEARDVKLACKAGCSFCCHFRVDAYAHEVIYAADYIRSHLTPEQIQGIVAKSAAHAKKMAAMSLAQQMSSNNACPLLVEGRCSAYEGRPMSCRNHHATNVKLCEQVFETCDPSTPASHDEALYWNTRAVWMGVAKAFEVEGYDATVYDFGSAIGEALENPVTARRWRDKKRAFSASALAKDQPTAEALGLNQPAGQRKP